MAVEVEATSQLDEFLGVLKRRVWAIVLPATLISAIGISIAIVIPKKYVSSTRVMLRDVESDGGGGSGEGTSEGRVAEHTIRSPARVRAVLKELAWDDYLVLVAQDESLYVDRTLGNLEVETPPMDRYAGQQLVRAEFAHVEATRARDFLENLMARWRTEVLERRHNQTRQAHDDLKESRVQTEDVLKSIGRQISELRQLHGIPPALQDGDRVKQRLAPQFTALEVEKEELLEFEEAYVNALILRDRLVSARDRMEDEVPFTTKVQADDTAKRVQAVDTGIAQLESTLAARGWLPAHRKYRLAQSEIGRLRRERDALVAAQTAAFIEQIMVPNDVKVRASAQVEDAGEQLVVLHQRLTTQDDKVAAMNIEVQELQDAYVQLGELGAEQARKHAILQATETQLESVRQELAQLDGPMGNPFEVQDSPNLPTSPTEPNPWLIGAFSVLAGLAVGLAAAIAGEYSKSTFRTAGDLARVMAVPVLATVNVIVTRKQARRATAKRLAVGGITTGFVVILAYITWAFAFRQDLLSPEVRDSIEAFRGTFK
jgi:uncharacterized protein involved in exopolysaccharide biosynthesis